jgi:FKBP-type peptidyl-prolyl cis-trans isomerase SlyD
MEIGAKKAVTFHYSLKDDDGNVLDSSDGRQPLTYLHGEGNIVPGLEKALDGKKPGDEVKATVPPAEGYGERNEENILNVPRRRLPEGKLEPGMSLHMRTDQGQVLATILGIKGDYVRIDANHPLAGKTLHFDVKVREVRAATAEEIEHGHAHGPEGHEHD